MRSAALELQKVYFEDAIQQVANYGTVEDLASVTAAELYAYYLEMLQNDQIQIFHNSKQNLEYVLARAG